MKYSIDKESFTIKIFFIFYEATMKLSILTYPHPFLKTVAKPVKTVDTTVRQIIKDMFETMYAEEGSGLAAVQVGIDKRIIVMDIETEDMTPKAPLIFINPEIVKFSEEKMLDPNGCLSVPGIYGANIERSSEIIVHFLNDEGKKEELHAKDLLAVCIQHEIDHLNGILFVDHLSRLKRERLFKKYSKQA